MSADLLIYGEVEAEVTEADNMRVKVGNLTLIFSMETAEAIATALRFHQMCEWGDREDAH